MNAHRCPLLVIVVALIATFGIFQGLTLGNPKPQDTPAKGIEVRLIPKRKSTKAGEALEVRVEIWNVGYKWLFIENNVYNLCLASPLVVRLELGPPMKPPARPGSGCAADCVYTAKLGFTGRLVSRWTVLPPGHFYGTVISIYPDTFPQLNTPGRWRLGGTYKSLGDLSSFHCWDTAPIPDNEDQIKGLPYEAWQGEVETNTAWIEVARASKSVASKKSP